MTRPPFENFPEIVSSRIRLRQFLPDDADRIVDVTFFQRIPAKDAADVVVMLGKIDERYQNGEGIHWGIQDLKTGEYIGCCGFYRGFANDTGEIGYFLKEQFRNKGYMSEA